MEINTIEITPNTNSIQQSHIEVDPLTGLYFSHTFFAKSDDFLKTIEADTHCMVSIDIEHFRLFNKFYKREQGDILLKNIADFLNNVRREHSGVIGYLTGDNFGALIPYDHDLLNELRRGITQIVRKWNKTVGFLPAFGVYQIVDTTIPAATMYDLATIAMSQVLGNYTNRISIYSPLMNERVEEEILFLSEIQDGLDKEEFTFFIQPQCDISTGKIVGGESLVRWKHGLKGYIPPGMFIPVLERNGFIATLDCYLWDKVCQWLRSWIDRGYQPVPISINVSRIDIFSMDVPAYLKELLDKYNLPAKLLKVEITESAYAESNDKIFRTVKQLRDANFLVMMDDFGSGYSSLNMLKSVAVDVLKLDMRFLDIKDQEEEKGISIIESVVNMARQLHIPIVVEGVETQKQESFLLKMGCRYSQGYYYYKPMSIEDFEKLASDERNLDFDGIWCRQTESLHIREFLDSNLFSDATVNNILGAAAFYDMYENNIEITRVNEHYFTLAGIPYQEESDYKKKFWNHVRDDDRNVLFAAFAQAYESPTLGGQCYIHFLRPDGTTLRVYIRLFFLREKDGHKIFYGSLTDMTSLLENKSEAINHDIDVDDLTDKQLRRLEKSFENLPCGYGVGKIILDEAGNPKEYEIIYANSEARRISNGDISRLRHMMIKTFDKGMDAILEKSYRAAYLGETTEHTLYSPSSCRYLKITMYQYQYGYVSCMVQDITHFRIYENTLNNILLSYREVYFVQLQDNYCRMIYPDNNHLLERGNYEEVVNRHFGTGKILPYDAENVRRFLSLDNIKNVLKNNDTTEYKYRRSIKDIGEEWCLATFNICERQDGVPKTAILTIRSIEALMRENEERKHQVMAGTLANMSDGFFIYEAVGNEKIHYANPTVLNMFGCDTMDEFNTLVNNSFSGMIHPDDLNRVQWEIKEQIQHSDKKMDYIKYRIIRKDGQIRWIDDCGHLEDADRNNKLFYVFISDITDTISEQEKNKLIVLSAHHNK